MKTHLITGGAGFIPVNLARRLMTGGDRVIAVDDLSRGKLSALTEFQDSNLFAFRQADCAERQAIEAAIAGIEGPIDEVWHMAANSDIPAGVADHRIDLHRTFMTTVGTLEFMKALGIGTLHFASSSAIYGDFGETEIHEDIGPLQPISNYGSRRRRRSAPPSRHGCRAPTSSASPT